MILTILFGVIGFGIMIFVHELGHFIAAKRVDIQVEVFSLGWGRKLVGFDYRGTNYRLSLIPFGGYCKMKGEDPFRSQERGGEGSFFVAPPWKRIVVSVAGPTANILFALVVLTVIWWAGFTVHSDGNRIVLADQYSLDSFQSPTPASQAGLQTGDRIVAVDGQPVEKFQDLLEMVSTSPNSRLVLSVRRDGRTLSVPIVPELDKQTGAGKIGVYAWRDPVVAGVQKGTPADLAGLKEGDRIVQAGGAPVHNTIDFYQALEQAKGSIPLVAERGGRQVQETLVVSTGEGGVPQPGLTFRTEVFRSPRLGLPGAVARGAEETWRTLVLSIKGIGLLFQGVNLRNAVVGPLRITYYVGSVATAGFALGFSEGLVNYFRFLCLLSVVLFMMNLLPIPALDGGQVVVYLAEVVRRKPVSAKTIYRIQMIGFSFLFVLAVVITFSDILFFMGR